VTPESIVIELSLSEAPQEALPIVKFSNSRADRGYGIVSPAVLLTQVVSFLRLVESCQVS
jgi:hypothetical protein